MRDEYSVKLRVLFAVLLACALAAYAWFLYPSLHAGVSEKYRSYLFLEREKAAIAQIMVNPEEIGENIKELQAKLVEARQIGTLTPAEALNDINDSLSELGLEPDSISLGQAIAAAEVMSDGKTLREQPVIVRFRGTYDGGMYFLAALEKNETGTYKIDDFSFLPAEPAETEEAEGSEKAEEGGAGDETGDEDGYRLFDWFVTARLLYYGDGES
ncbi:MAG: hypothetical protein LBT26_06345 [Clostridiales Family XIII bacterium]|jgi:hypothetical protein|nr:hypothetical protein [Clostridiales Family XIII bacterium]